MSDTPFNPDEEAQLYEELGLTRAADDVLGDDHMEAMLAEGEAKRTQTDERPNPASAVVVQVPDVNEVEFDDSLINHLDVSDPQQRAEASRLLFARYGGAAYGLPKGTHRSNWNALIHQRISMHLGRKVTAARQSNEDTLARKVSQASAGKVADQASISTQAALRVLKDQILDEDGQIDMDRFAQLLKEA